ncbi:MAG: VCBS repeat-containing protein, partial [Flavobacteriales bacterium]|nr:VCBS repeat-containing protein [Flavobacteriales bacterium]
ISLIGMTITATAQFGGGHELMVEGPQCLELADLDQDGDRELIVAGRDGVVAFPNVNGMLMSPALLGADRPVIHMADLDGDGSKDLVASSEALANVVWERNLGSFVLGPEQVVFGGDAAYAIRSGDLDNDGDLDLVLSLSSGVVQWMRNNGQGQFMLGGLVAANAGGAIVSVIDVDHDGDVDLVWSDPFIHQVRWAENINGQGVLSGPLTLDASGIGSVNDVDGDGLVDLVLSTPMTGTVRWKRSLQSGYGPALPVGEMWGTSDVILAQDLDLDGDVDVAVASDELDEIAWYENVDGLGLFGPKQVIATAIQDVHLLVAEDLDSDGDPELFAASNAQYRVVWFDNLAVAGNSIVGRVFNDVNANGTFDGADHGMANFRVEATDLSATFTNHSGMYSFQAVPGPYQVWLPPVGDWTNTTPDNYQVSVTTLNNSALEKDFGLHAVQAVVAASTELIHADPRCNEVVPFWITVTNTGTVTMDLQALLLLDTLSTFIGSIPGPDGTNGSMPYWDMPSLPVGQQRSVQAFILMPNEDHVGETLLDSLAITATVNGGTQHFGSSSQVTLECAVDPNDKLVLPQGVGEEHRTAMGSRLTYTIRFQNTGNAEAHDVLLIDSLSALLDLRTLTPLASSHTCRVHLQADGVLQVSYPDIHLPDSASDPLGSQGYFRFAIDHVPDIAFGARIENRAGIYFDQNAPIITNTAFNTMGTEGPGTSVPRPFGEDAVAFPQPAMDSFRVVPGTAFTGNNRLILFDARGARIMTANSSQPVIQVDASRLEDGVYIAQVMDDHGRSAMVRVVVAH